MTSTVLGNVFGDIGEHKRRRLGIRCSRYYELDRNLRESGMASNKTLVRQLAGILCRPLQYHRSHLSNRAGNLCRSN